jgi:hypothetical protein
MTRCFLRGTVLIVGAAIRVMCCALHSHVAINVNALCGRVIGTLLRIRDVPSTDLGPETGYNDSSFR